MSADDENRFRPKPGRVRSDTPKAGRTRSFFTQAKKLARQHRTANPKYAPRLESRTAAKGGKGSRAAKGPGVRRGRGAAFVRARTLSGGWRAMRSKRRGDRPSCAPRTRGQGAQARPEEVRGGARRPRLRAAHVC